MKTVFNLLLLCIGFQSFAEDAKPYSIEHINSDIIRTENSIVRKDITKIQLTGNKAFEFNKLVVTLMNDTDYNLYSDFVVPYSNGEVVNDFNLSVFDAEGDEIKKYKAKEIQDVSLFESSLFTDNRYKYAGVSEYDYPFTIEFSYSKKIKDTYLLNPTWYLHANPKSYVELVSLEVEKPATLDFTLEYHLHDAKLTQDVKKPTRLYFEAKNLHALKKEDFGPPSAFQLPHLIYSLHDFDIEGYRGSFESWSSLGDFYYRLNEDRYDIDAAVLSAIQYKLEQASNMEEKVQLIYEHLQQKTRYVSVQLGVGGWQSFPAEYVEKNSFGDCKALTTYTKSLLQQVGVESHPVLIHSTRDGDQRNFEEDKIAYNGFNHVILAVPNEQDTIWLECTSQVQPFNYLGSSTMDRKGLMIKPNGESKLVETPKTKPEQDSATRKLDVYLREDGSAKIEMKYTAIGVMAEYLYHTSERMSESDFEEELSDIIDLPNSEVVDYTIETAPSGMGVELKAEFESKNVANKTGSRLFLTPLHFQNNRSAPESLDNRKHPMVLPYSYSKVMDITYHLPDGYTVENVEKDPVSLSTTAASFNTEYNSAEQMLQVKTVYTQTRGMYPKESVADYKSFVDEMNGVLKRMAVFKEN